MTECWQVGPGTWLGFAWCPPALPAAARVERWRRDRCAAERAVAAAVAATGRAWNECATSRAHTAALGAALAGPVGARLGVDLVPVDRVGRRHAHAVLSAAEVEVLEPYASIRPALAWAVKEAAAKAVGDPLRCFPHGLTIGPSGAGIRVREVRTGGVELEVRWGLLGGVLYAWCTTPA